MIKASFEELITLKDRDLTSMTVSTLGKDIAQAEQMIPMFELNLHFMKRLLPPP